MNEQQHPRGAEFNRLTVLNFRALDANALHAVAQDLALPFAPAALAFLQHYYRVREGRDATVGELRLLGAFASKAYNDPRTMRIGGLTGEEEMLRIWRDVICKQKALQDTLPPTSSELTQILPRYLARAGIEARDGALFCGTNAELAMRCHGEQPELVLELAHSAAARIKVTPSPLPPRAALVLLSPREGISLENEIATLFSLPIGAYLCPIAAPNAEGLLPHLLPLGGVMLDTAAIPGFPTDAGAAALTEIGQGRMLLAAPEAAIAALFRTELSLSLIGTLLPSGRLQLRHGTESTLSLDLNLFRSLQAARTVTPTLQPPSLSQSVEVRCTENADTLLCGVEVCDDVTEGLLHLATEAVRRGAVLEKATVGVLLALPQNGERALAAALPLQLELHRAAAELTLPTDIQRTILIDRDKPFLAIFLSAPKGAAREITQPKSFAEARVRFYGV